MQQIERKERYIIKCEGTLILGSVCSFAHDHAILKMMDLLGRLKDADINYIACGGEGKLPVEYCEAEIEFRAPEGEKNKQIREHLDALIKETGHKGITCEIITEDPFLPHEDLE